MLKFRCHSIPDQSKSCSEWCLNFASQQNTERTSEYKTPKWIPSRCFFECSTVILTLPVWEIARLSDPAQTYELYFHEILRWRCERSDWWRLRIIDLNDHLMNITDSQLSAQLTYLPLSLLPHNAARRETIAYMENKMLNYWVSGSSFSNNLKKGFKWAQSTLWCMHVKLERGPRSGSLGLAQKLIFTCSHNYYYVYQLHGKPVSLKIRIIRAWHNGLVCKSLCCTCQDLM